MMTCSNPDWAYPSRVVFITEHVMYGVIGTLVVVANITIILAWGTKKSLRIKKEMVSHALYQ